MESVLMESVSVRPDGLEKSVIKDTSSMEPAVIIILMNVHVYLAGLAYYVTNLHV